jgi:hypothetical protein
MGLKRYIYKYGLDVIAPLKCGTRWLEDLDVDNRTHHSDFDVNSLKENVHSGTTFIWRPVREHFHSAIQTEWSITPDEDVRNIIIALYRGECGHWHPHLYKELYPIWEKTGFRFHKLRALSELIPSQGELNWMGYFPKWTSTSTKFRLPTEWDSIEGALNSLPSEDTIKLNKLIDDEEKWLKLMIESQYSEKIWKEYSDLEDSVLEMKCKYMILETELKRTKILLSTRYNKLI